ncbi:hypothetical protein FB107DRAFT_255001, partial [Schizophyllum commune]
LQSLHWLPMTVLPRRPSHTPDRSKSTAMNTSVGSPLRVSTTVFSTPSSADVQHKHHGYSRDASVPTNSRKRQRAEGHGRPAMRPRLSDAALTATSYDSRAIQSRAARKSDRQTTSKSRGRRALMDFVLDRRQEAFGLQGEVALDNVALAMLLAPRLQQASSSPSGSTPRNPLFWSGSSSEISPPASSLTFPDSFERHLVREP